MISLFGSRAFQECARGSTAGWPTLSPGLTTGQDDARPIVRREKQRNPVRVTSPAFPRPAPTASKGNWAARSPCSIRTLQWAKSRTVDSAGECAPPRRNWNKPSLLVVRSSLFAEADTLRRCMAGQGAPLWSQAAVLGARSWLPSNPSRKDPISCAACRSTPLATGPWRAGMWARKPCCSRAAGMNSSRSAPPARITAGRSRRG